MDTTDLSLTGMIVSWCSKEEDDGPYRSAGRGRITTVITAGARPLLLVSVIPRAGDTEPPHCILLAAGEPGLVLCPSTDAEDLWFAWMMEDPKRVVSLVPPNG